MLDRMTPQQFDEWVAYRNIEADPEDRLRRIVTTGFLALCKAWGMDLEPEDLDVALKEAKSEPEEMTPNQAVAALRMNYGF